MRDALENVSVAVKEKALDVETATPSRTILERVSDMRPGQGGPAARKRRREMQRQLEAVKRVTQTLERVGAGMPMLLEGGKVELKRLGETAWDGGKEGPRATTEEVRAIGAQVPGAWWEKW